MLGRGSHEKNLQRRAALGAHNSQVRLAILQEFGDSRSGVHALDKVPFGYHLIGLFCDFLDEAVEVALEGLTIFQPKFGRGFPRGRAVMQTRPRGIEYVQDVQSSMIPARHREGQFHGARRAFGEIDADHDLLEGFGMGGPYDHHPRGRFAYAFGHERAGSFVEIG